MARRPPVKDKWGQHYADFVSLFCVKKKQNQIIPARLYGNDVGPLCKRGRDRAKWRQGECLEHNGAETRGSK